MPLRNTAQRYGIVAILLHWLMAVLLVALLVMGFYMAGLPDVGFSMTKIELIFAHKEFGVLAFLFVAARLAWRVTNLLPRLVATIPEWQQIAARFVHLSFYGVIFALPVTGWLMSSASGLSVSFFGLFTLPDLIGYDDYLFQRFLVIHTLLGYALSILLAVHAGAALHHHFFRKDETLKKILPIARL